MDDSGALAELTAMVSELSRRAALEVQTDRRNALLRTTVVPSEKVPGLLDLVAELMGPAVKPAGASAWWKNWFDPFFRSVGGIQRDQTLFRRQLSPGVNLYCAFWPWSSDPRRTSLRIGISRG